MTIGICKGEKVQDSKKNVHKLMITNNETGTHMNLADAGDTLEDANFVFDMADAGLL